MLEQRQGNLLEERTEAIVNTVNTAGVMGKGVALQFKRRYPDNYRAYVAACKAGEVQVGRMFTTELPPTFEGGPRYIVNFPTKQHWRGGARLEYIQAGLQDLTRLVRERGIRSIALPALGCGNGGLLWSEVRPIIEQAFAALPDVDVVLYPPEQAPEPEAASLTPRTPRPTLVRSNAAMLRLFQLYLLPDYTLGRTEAQKLMYFLQEGGLPLKFSFAKNQFGPYADNVRHVLERMEGHYISGLGSGEGPSHIHLLPGAAEEAQQLIQADPEAHGPLERVAALIEGFESPYSMELLATVHWVAHREGARTPEQALERIGAWNERKRDRMRPEHVQLAWNHLQEHGWLPSA